MADLDVTPKQADEARKDAAWKDDVEAVAMAVADLVEAHEAWPASAVVAGLLRVAAIVTAREGASPLKIAAQFCRDLDTVTTQINHEMMDDILGKIALASIPSHKLPQV